jgi:hypothetical protein
MNESITKNLFLATRDRAAEVALRKELQEKERQQKLEVKRKEQEERLKRIGEHKNQLILQRAREKAERELQKSKAVIDRRLAHLEQEKVRKEEILQKAHSATSRTAQNSQKKVFAFGSSTPRELSYLEKLSKDQKQYDRKLAPPSTTSSNASPSITPPRDTHSTRNSSVTRGPKLMLGNNMTSSLYVPKQVKTAAPRISPPKRTSPAKVFPTAKENPMTQSLYVSKKSSTPPNINKSTQLKARNISPAKPLANKRSPATSMSQSPAQRKPPIPRAPTTGTPIRAPPKAQVIEKTESPKPKAIIPRKFLQQQVPSEPTNPSIAPPIIVAEEQETEALKDNEGHISPPSTPAVGPLSNEEHKIEPQEIVEAVEKQFYVAPNVEEDSDEQSVEQKTYGVDENEETKVISNPSEPKSLQDELMDANYGIDFGDSESQVINDNTTSHDNAPNEIVEQSEAKQPLLQPEEIVKSVEEHYKNVEAEVVNEKPRESEPQEQVGHDAIESGHNISYSLDDAISGLANLQLQTPQKDANIVTEQNFINFGDETPVAEPQPPQFIQGPSKVDSLDLSPLKKDDGFSESEEKLMDTNQQGNGNETSRVESPDQGPFSSSSSAKESDAENTDIVRMSDDKKEKPPERKARLSEILAKARQGMSISPPNTNATPTNNATSNGENNSQTAVDAKLLALKLIEQRRQEKMATGIENDTTVSSDNISESEPTITANNNTNGNGQRLSLAEELAVANQTKPLDILPGQPIYDSDYKIMNGKTTPPEDPSHVQLV